jgi:hypothetical protein
VDHNVQSAGNLQPHGVLAHSGKGTERSEAGRHGGSRVRVDRSAAPGVSGIHSRQQFADLGSAAFPHHQAVGSHSEGLPYQFGEVHRTAAFKVSVPRLK